MLVDGKEWRLVPVEPTDKMAHAGIAAIGTLGTYRAMIAAAPTPPDVARSEPGASAQQTGLCRTCNGTGDVTDLNGEWCGYCWCGARPAALAPSESPTPDFKSLMKSLHHADDGGKDCWEACSVREKALMMKIFNAFSRTHSRPLTNPAYRSGVDEGMRRASASPAALTDAQVEAAARSLCKFDGNDPNETQDLYTRDDGTKVHTRRWDKHYALRARLALEAARLTVSPAAPQPSAKALTDEALMQIAEQHGWVIKQTGRAEWLVCSTNTPGNFLALARALLAAEQRSEDKHHVGAA